MRVFLILFMFLAFACSPKKGTDSKQAEEVKSADQPTESAAIKAGWESYEVAKLDIDGYYPKFVDGSQKILYTTSTYEGLWLYDLKTGKKQQLTDEPGAGFKPVISGDQVIYQVRARKKYLKKVSLSAGAPVQIDGTTGMMPAEYAQSRSSEVSVSLSGDLSGIEISKDGEVQKIAPQGAKNYITAAISPDQQRLVYKVGGLGAFISDLEGNTLLELGDVDAPSWMSDALLLFSESKDDGMQQLSSEVFVYDLNRKVKHAVQVSGVSLENPKANETGDQIVANTPGGEIYIFTLK